MADETFVAGAPVTQLPRANSADSAYTSIIQATDGSVILDEREFFIDYKPWWLLLEGASSFGKQTVFFLLFYIQSVFLTNVEGAHDILVNCDDHGFGLPLVLYCKATKDLVRGFFLIAATVSLVLIGRLLLYKYIWACFLRIGVVLDFENTAIYRDPLVVLVLLEFFLASLHFVLYFWADVQVVPAQAITYFFSPAAAFMILFYGQYDIEAWLLTLNKYCEASHPDHTHRYLVKLAFVKEETVAQVVCDMCRERAASPPLLATNDDSNLPFDTFLRGVANIAKECDTSAPRAQERFFVNRVMSSFWPTILFFDPCLRQTASIKGFFCMWKIFAGLTLLWMVVTTFGGYGESVVYRLKAVHEQPADAIYVALDGIHFCFLLGGTCIFANLAFRVCSWRRCRRKTRLS